MRDAADFWAERRIAFRGFCSFAVTRHAADAGSWERVNDVVQAPEKPVAKAGIKNGVNPNFATIMPMMRSAFDTAMWIP